MHRTASPLRLLAAVLCLIASFAYVTRGAGPSGQASGAGLTLQVGHRHHSGEHASTHETEHPDPEPDGHPAGHCLFCVTGAFALGAAVTPLPNLMTVSAPRAPPTRVHLALPAPRHADARAPPSFIA